MTDISDKIQQLKNLSGIFTGAGGDRIPPHGTTHTKNGPDPIPSELDGIPVDLDGMSTGETIVLGAGGELVPGAALGSLTDLQTAYDNGGSVTLDAEDLTITLGNSKKLIFKDKDGNAAFTFEDVGADNRVTINPDILKLKDSNVTTAIDLSSVGNVEFITTDKSIVGAVNELAAAAANYFDKTVDDSDDITEGATNLFLTAAERAAIADAYLKTTDDASDIQLAPLPDSDGYSVQDMIDFHPGRGVITVPTITDNLDGTISIGVGTVFGSKLSAAGSPKQFFDIPALANQALYQGVGGIGATNYVGFDLGSTPTWVVVADPSGYLPPREDRMIVDLIFYEADGTVHQLGATPGFKSHHTMFAQRAFDFALGKGNLFVERASGAVLGNTGIRYATLTAGSFWAGYAHKVSADMDTSGTDRMDKYYYNGSAWVKVSGVAQLDNTQYNNVATGLVAMNTGRFKCIHKYLDYEGDLMVYVEGQAQYTSLALAEEEKKPTLVPPIVSQFSIYLGRHILQQGSDVVITESAFAAEIGVGAVTSHAELSNLQADPTKLHHNSIPVTGEKAWEATQTSIVGSTDAAGVKNRDLELLKTYTNTDNNRYIAISPNGKYAAVSEIGGTAELVLYDVRSMKEIKRITQAFGPVEFIDDSTLVIMSSVDLDYYRVPGLTLIQNITLTITALADIGVGRISEKVYTARGTNILYRHSPDGSADADTGVLPSLTSVLSAFVLSDDEQTLYVVDAPTGAAGNVYFRIYNISTFTSPSLVGSVQLTSTVAGELFAKLGMVNGHIVVSYTGGGVATSKSTLYVDISTPSSPSPALTSPAGSVFGRGVYIIGGKLWLSNGADIYIAQLPALTLYKPDFEDDRGGNAISSADGFTDVDGNDILWDKQDVGRAVVDIQPLKQNQFGAVIESVETAEPGSPEVGKYYLMDSTSTWHPNTIAFYDILGWTIYQPYSGAAVRDAAGVYAYEYYIDQWMKKVNCLLYGTTNDGAGTGDSTILTLDGTNYPTVQRGAGDSSTYGEVWSGRMTVTATQVGDLSLEPAYSQWTLDFVAAGGNFVSADDASINGQIPAVVNMVASFTPNSAYSTPTVSVVDATGQIHVEVEHTDALAYDVTWVCEIESSVKSSYSRIPLA